MSGPNIRCFPAGSDQTTIDRLADIADTCSVDLLVPEAFSCAVCLELMVCPVKCFPCRHSFCEPCLRLITHAGDPLDILCPVCRQAVLCCRPNTVLKNQILRVDPLMASAYESRLDSFRHQEAYREMRLPGISQLGILPKIGAWLPGGNRLADYLVRKLFGLLTGPDYRSRLLSKLYSFVCSLILFLLLPSTYLSIVLAHPLPSAAQENVNCTFNMSDADDNSSDIFTPLPGSAFAPGQLSLFRFLAWMCMLEACVFGRTFSKARLSECGLVTSMPTERLKALAILFLRILLFLLFIVLCSFLHFGVRFQLFGESPYWSDCNDFAVLQFSVYTFVCVAHSVEMLLALLVRASANMAITDVYFGRLLLLLYGTVFLMNWIVVIVLDCCY